MYTTESFEFLYTYNTLDSYLLPTRKTCTLLDHLGDCTGCVFNYDELECQPFKHLLSTFDKIEFESQHPEALI